jgi:hypothetical protein
MPMSNTVISIGRHAVIMGIDGNISYAMCSWMYIVFG